jgi:hypothetical protein
MLAEKQLAESSHSPAECGEQLPVNVLVHEYHDARKYFHIVNRSTGSADRSAESRDGRMIHTWQAVGHHAVARAVARSRAAIHIVHQPDLPVVGSRTLWTRMLLSSMSHCSGSDHAAIGR